MLIALHLDEPVPKLYYLPSVPWLYNNKAGFRVGLSCPTGQTLHDATTFRKGFCRSLTGWTLHDATTLSDRTQ
jgi:hypothetical protein